MITKRGRFGVALTFEAPVLKTTGAYAVIGTDWTPGAGDVKVSKDGGNVADITTLPTLLGGTGSKQSVWNLSAAEMEAGRVLVQVVDAALQDDTFLIETLPDGAIATGKASAGGASTITLATGLAITAGAIVHIHGGTGAGQALFVNGYVSGTGVATMENAWATQPDATSLYTVWPSPLAPATTVPDVNVTKFGGTTGTFAAGIPEVKVASLAANAITAAAIAADAVDADALAADAVTEIQSGLATAAALAVVDDFLDTEITAILARLPATLTADGNMKSDVLRIIGVALQGNGTLGNEFRPV